MNGTPFKRNTPRRYICRPQYGCKCNGRATSYSTMIRHRDDGNERLREIGKPANLTNGPEESRASNVIEEFNMKDLCGDLALASSKYLSTEEHSTCIQ